MFRKLISYFAIILMVSTVSAVSNTTYSTPQSATQEQQIREYYDPVAGLTGAALKTALHNLISTNTYSSYDGAKVIMFQQLDNTNGVVRCVYTGEDFTIASNYSGQTSPNCEHTYAQSWFTTSASVEKADLHHLFVTEMTVNSSRGNFPFGKVVTPTNTYASFNGYVSKRGSDVNNQTVFEPADQHKGDCARAILYFNVRYNESLTYDSVNMLPAMLQWHFFDPPTPAEISRNTEIYSTLTNRNPFVDHPEYVKSIWVGTTNNTMLNFSAAASSVAENVGTVQLTIQLTNPNVFSSTANIVLKSGNAAHIGNFTPVTITFPSNNIAPQTVTLNITDDDIVDGNEVFVFEIQNAQGGYYAIPGQQNAYTLTVLDNDPIDNNDPNVVSVKSSINSVYPNPFNPETTIKYDVANAGNVSLVIYNVKGQKIRTLVSDNLTAGSFSVNWDGKDDNGNAKASSVYYLKMQTGHDVSIKKIVLIK